MKKSDAQQTRLCSNCINIKGVRRKEKRQVIALGADPHFLGQN